MSQTDLHMHSSASIDGEVSPRGLAELCCQEGLTLASLTDHNTVSGVPEFIWRGAQLGVRTVPGVELDCILDGVPLHILGYGIDIADQALLEVEASVQQMQRAASGQLMDAVARLGIRFERDAVLEKARNGVVTAEAIAEAALREPQNSAHPLMRPLFPGGGRDGRPLVNFYWDICAPGKAAYVPVNYMAAARAIQIIHAAGGLAVLAHPAASIGLRTEPLDKLAELSLDGVEVFSSYHSANAALFYRHQADEYGLLATGGSDFHGRVKPDIRLGQIDFMGLEDVIRSTFLIDSHSNT